MNIPGKDAPASRGDLKELAHFAISVGSKENVDDMASKFKKEGFTLLSAPRITGDGYYECAIADPEGNYVEISGISLLIVCFVFTVWLMKSHSQHVKLMIIARFLVIL